MMKDEIFLSAGKRMNNPGKEKAMLFSVRIVKLHQFLRREKKEFTISDQILRSGTSIGANIAEAEYAASDKDMLNKLQIALKERNSGNLLLVGTVIQNRFRSGETVHQFDERLCGA